MLCSGIAPCGYLGEHIQCQGTNLSPICARQAPHILYQSLQPKEWLFNWAHFVELKTNFRVSDTLNSRVIQWLKQKYGEYVFHNLSYYLFPLGMSS